ncbi:hypothetical protein TDMWS_18760 [Thermodesulfomicrobium sp. WS]|uniref:glycosyltransferase family 4 protein n=1 Tax=Thermodesulfomicrobium sp. WS TaxID=3004129 RepID=UPI0024903082|nr:glycosyltransferase family 4 protein [Thermodesulfomicrobium sp. WS]BDV01791.1 hypothetical protein TDMWS_18760 [Thermodesulfomicrobium sp. WS]
MLRHLLYIAASRIPSRHANSVQVAHMLCAFAAQVEEVTAILPATWRGITAHLCGRLLTPYGLTAPANLRIVFRSLFHPSHFETQAMSRLPSADLIYTRSAKAALALASGPTPVLMESHDPVRDDAKAGILRLAQALGHNANGLVAISQSICQRYQQAGLAPDRILVAHAAVDSCRFAQSQGGLLARLCAPNALQRPVVLYCGSLQPGKGARFAARLAAQMPDVHIAIVGGSPEEIRALGEEAHAPNLLLHPAVPHAQVPDLLADADILLLPYTKTERSGPTDHTTASLCPIKVFEALAAGAPIVAADLPVLREVLTPETAFFFPPADAAACAAAIRRALTLTPEERQRRRTLAQSQAWSWEQRAQRILAWWTRRRDTHSTA